MVEVPTILFSPDSFDYGGAAFVTWTFGRFDGFDLLPGLGRDLFLSYRRLVRVVTPVIQVDRNG